MKALEDYLGGLIVSQGEGVGRPLRLMPWQRDFIRGAFAPGVQIAALTMGRGNGKTALAAGIASAYLDGPLAQPRGQCIVAAASLNQARVLFGHSLAFLEANHGALRRPDWRVVQSPNEVSIRRLETGAEVKAIASDPARAHGLAGSVIVDEPAQHPPAHRDRLWAALQTQLGKLPDSRAIVLGTRPAAGSGHYFEDLLDGGADFALRFAADRDSDPLDRRAWERANPSLRHFPALAATIAREAKRAAANPELLPAFRALRLNAGVLDTAQTELVTATAWGRCVGEAPMEPPIAWGIDLGSTAAMSALAAYSLTTGALNAIAAFPSIPDLAERARLDAMGDKYDRMRERGELLIHPGRVVEVPWLLEEAVKRWGPPVLIAADYHRRAELRDALDRAAIPPAKLELRQGGFGDGAEDVARFRRAVLSLKVIAAPSLLLATAIGEARTIANAAGLEKIGKSNLGGRRHRARDDAAVAAVCAVAVGERNRRRVEASRTGPRFAVARRGKRPEEPAGRVVYGAAG